MSALSITPHRVTCNVPPGQNDYSELHRAPKAAGHEIPVKFN